MKFAVWTPLTLGLAILAGPTLAQSSTAYVVTNPRVQNALHAPSTSLEQRYGAQHFTRTGDHSLTIMTNTVSVGDAVVNRELAYTPTRPDLYRLVYANTTAIYLDPTINYHRRSHYRLDEGHSILRAQQLVRSLNNPGVTVVRNPRLADPKQDEARIVPRAIFHVPRDLQRKEQAPSRPMARVD